jgi:hydroxypyruvate isomerase
MSYRSFLGIGNQMNLKFSACLELLFVGEASRFEDRFALAKQTGFEAVEFWRWRNKDIDQIAAQLKATNLRLTGFVTEPMVPLTDNSQHQTFLDGLKESIGVAKQLGCTQLIAQAGNELPGIPRQVQHNAIVSVLKKAAPMLEEDNVTLLLEPLNTLVDHPGYYLSDTREGLDIIAEVGSDSVKLLYDIYHSVVMGEEPSEVLTNRVHLIGHVHLADVPGRHEPGSGTMPWQAHLDWLKYQGYTGYVGLEYRPSKGTAHSLEALFQSVNEV